MPLQIVILAAGLGRRMHSELPKVLHPLAGKPLLQHVIDTAHTLNPAHIHVIYGHGAEAVQKIINDSAVHWVFQPAQKGTADAVSHALPFISEKDRVLILCGDVPLISTKTLQQLCEVASENEIGIVTTVLNDPTGYGRIVKNNDGKILAIVEEKDADESQKKIREIYTGIMLVKAAFLKEALSRIDNQNAQGEFYLTSAIDYAVKVNRNIQSVCVSQPEEVAGVNDRLQLQQLERYYQMQKAHQLLMQGVTLADAARLDIRGELNCGRDVFIDVNVVSEGKVTLEDGVHVEPFVVLRNVHVRKNTRIRSHCVIEQSEIGESCVIGPFARLRPETHLANHVHIGNFVETKKIQMGENSKASHLTYLGDAEIGKDVNIGAGTITCNYDGANKHKTIIGDRVFIGSDTQLIAPVKIGNDATIAAGSTVRKDVEANNLTVTHQVTQRTVSGWKRPRKEK